MARAHSRRGKLGLRFALIVAGVGLVVGTTITMLVLHTAGGDPGPVSRARLIGFILTAIGAAVLGGVAWALGSGVVNRLTDLALAVNKLGRGSAQVRVRISGNDEITSLGNSIQYLSNDLTSLFEEQEKAGTLQVAFDPQVKQLRDRALPEQGLDAVEGYEVDAALAAGSRGGLDYYGGVGNDKVAAFYVVSAEGAGPLAVLACRMARDELQRALETGVTARKALAHTNRVLHRVLPAAVCARASVVELAATEIKLYQAGQRTPALVCAAGRIDEVVAEGLGLGLDEGPVFEKQLRSTPIDVTQGVRVVLCNDAGYRHEALRGLIKEHSPKNTAAFMNMVLGAIEDAAGSEGLREEVAMLTVKRW